MICFQIETFMVMVVTVWLIFVAGIVTGSRYAAGHIFRKIRDTGKIEISGSRIVGRVETKEWPK